MQPRCNPAWNSLLWAEVSCGSNVFVLIGVPAVPSWNQVAVWLRAVQRLHAATQGGCPVPGRSGVESFTPPLSGLPASTHDQTRWENDLAVPARVGDLFEEQTHGLTGQLLH